MKKTHLSINSRVPVSDKGHVTMLTPSLSSEQLRQAAKNNFDIDSLYKHIFITMNIKCPLFIKMTFSEFGLMTTTQSRGGYEYFTPDVTQVAAKTIALSNSIIQSINDSNEHSRIYAAAYRNDGCERSVSQVCTPLALYNNIVVSGFIHDWLSFANKPKLPALINLYRVVIRQLIMAEYQETLFNEAFQKSKDN